jgi:hypothetical protein
MLRWKGVTHATVSDSCGYVHIRKLCVTKLLEVQAYYGAALIAQLVALFSYAIVIPS